MKEILKKYLRDKYGVAWGIISLIGVILICVSGPLWVTGIGGSMIGVGYGAVWAKSINIRY